MKPVDLYQVLGVDRMADTPKINAAYRRAAKRAHPDGGGSVDKFELVALAKACLTDLERRRHYDETGEVGETPVDQDEAHSLTIAMNALCSIMDHIDKKGNDPAEYDVLGDAVRGLKDEISKSDQKISGIERELKKSERIVKMFKSRKGKPNKIAPMFQARIAEGRQAVSKEQREIERIKRAIEILKDHEFNGY